MTKSESDSTNKFENTLGEISISISKELFIGRMPLVVVVLVL